MYISMNEIESNGLKENIVKCEKEILNFTQVLKKHIRFNTDGLVSPAEIWHFFDENRFLTRDCMAQIITKEDSFEYVGNTRHDANHYEVIWAFDLINEKAPDISKVDFDSHLAEHMLYFRFSQNEILPTHAASDSRFFKMYVAGLSYSEDGTVENHHHQIAHNNNNYPLTSILNPKTATRAIQVINQTIDEYKLLASLKNEL